MRELWSQLILSRQRPTVVTLIGGGGKTSLMHYLINLLKGKGCFAVGTTTTKLSREPVSGYQFVEIENVEAGREAVAQARGVAEGIILIHGEEDYFPGKVIGIPRQWIDHLAVACPDTTFIVEGDGAAGKPLKGHLLHEPVVPSSSSLIVAVIGIDSVGARLTSQYVHRPDRICEVLESSPDSLVTTDMIVKLLFHAQGYLQHCPQSSIVVPFINKVESKEQYEQSKELACRILAGKHPQVCGVVVGSIKNQEGIWLQA